VCFWQVTEENSQDEARPVVVDTLPTVTLSATLEVANEAALI
jgi:hypothetical protein